MESRAPSLPFPACSSFHTIFPYSFCICPCAEPSILFLWEFPQIPLMNSNLAVSFLSWGKQHCTKYSRVTSLAEPMDTKGFIHEYLPKSFCIQLLGRCFFGVFIYNVLNKEPRSYILCCITACRAANQGKARAVGRCWHLFLCCLCHTAPSPIPLRLYSQSLLHMRVPEPLCNRAALCTERRESAFLPDHCWYKFSWVVWLYAMMQFDICTLQVETQEEMFWSCVRQTR